MTFNLKKKKKCSSQNIVFHKPFSKYFNFVLKISDCYPKHIVNPTVVHRPPSDPGSQVFSDRTSSGKGLVCDFIPSDESLVKSDDDKILF